MNITKELLAKENLIFFLLLFFALFLNSFHYDEALIYQRVENLKEFNRFSDDSNHEITFGLFFYSIYSKFSLTENIFQSYFLFRLFSFLSIILIFITGKKIIVNHFNFSKIQLLVFFFLIFFWFAFFSGGLTSRHDAILSFCLLFCFYSYLEYFKNKKKYYIYISLFISSAFISLHPFFLLPFILTLIIFFIEFIKIKNLKYKILLLSYVLFILSISFQLLIFKVLSIENILLFFDQTFNYISISNELSYGSHSSFEGLIINIKKELFELRRLDHLHNFNKLNYYILVFSLFFFINIFFNLKKNINNQLLFLFVISIIIFLTIMPNKWAHHLSIIVPFLFINLICVIFKLFENQFFFNSKKNYLILTILLTTLSFINLFFDLKNNQFFYNFLKLNKFEIANHKIFNRLESEQLKIEEINIKYKDLIFYSNPEHKYIFSNLKYAGHQLNVAIKKNLNLIFLEKKYNKKCSINNVKVKLKYIDEFKFENKSWFVCRVI